TFTPTNLSAGPFNVVIPGRPAASSQVEPGIQFFLHLAKELDRLAPSLALTLRAIGCADVRSGILPPQSGSVADEAGDGPGMTSCMWGTPRPAERIALLAQTFATQSISGARLRGTMG
ncbi:MAG: hypothetical protein ACREP0_12375, partial [Rhodanobacteraceae bacterium]